MSVHAFGSMPRIMLNPSSGGVERDPALLLRGGVAKKEGRVGVHELVEGRADDEAQHEAEELGWVKAKTTKTRDRHQGTGSSLRSTPPTRPWAWVSPTYSMS